MKRFSFICAICLAAVAFFGCSKDDPEALTMLGSEITVSNAGASQTLKFNTNSDWTISSAADWVTFDKASGTSGDASVVMTVAPNTTYDSRSTTVTIKAGSKVTSITVKQAETSVFTSEVLYEISSEAQDIEFALSSNVKYAYSISDDAKSWISASAKTKSAPVDGTVTFSVKANSTLAPRTGKVFIVAGSDTYCLTVKQDAEFTVMTSASAVYYGNRAAILQNDALTSFQEYVITLANADESVVLAVNAADQTSPLTAIPAGDYEVDAAASHAKNTFTIKSTNGSEQYYTVMLSGNKETVVEDGQITITAVDGGYQISCVLVDALGKEHKFSYVGAISLADKSTGANMASCSFINNYYTYFTSGVNQWNVALNVNVAMPGKTAKYHYVSFTINGAAGTVNGSELPVGTFKYEPAATDESVVYSTGNTKATSGTFTGATCSAAENDVTIYYEFGEGATLTVSKNADGTFNFALKGTLAQYKYDENGNYVSAGDNVSYDGSYDNVIITVDTESASKPSPDGDIVASSIMNSGIVALWFGVPYATTTSNVFATSLYYVNSNYTVSLTLVTDPSFSYVKNFNNRYCSTAIPNGTYTFTKTPTTMNIVPTASYNKVTNGYTGTDFKITGGTVTFTGTKITYNLTLLNTRDGVTTNTLTGSHDASWYYSRDYSSKQSIVKIVE